jgi:hypothetical protein
MLDRVAKYWPVLTVVALAAVSLFNIGYFSAIGLQFIGVMDSSNIVYSIAIILGVLLFPAIMIQKFFSWLPEFMSRPDAVQRTDKVFGVVAAFSLLIMIGGVIVGRLTYGFAIAFCAMAFVSTLSTYVLWVSKGTLSKRLAFRPVLFWTMAIFQVGNAWANYEAFDSSAQYTLVTKENRYANVRLVRTSSNGFIIARDSQIVYIPAGELKSIEGIASQWTVPWPSR